MKCYFFGTFNPIHNGHLEIARQIKEQFDFEKVIFVVAYCPVHKDTGKITPEDRLKMACLSAGKENVSDVEFFLPIPSYSFNSVMELKKRDKTGKINMICGYDSFLTIESWKNPEILKQNVNFIIIPRRTKSDIKEPFEHLKKRGWNYQIADIEFLDISSNMIRDYVKEEKDIDNLVEEKTKRYIYEHGLYRRETKRVLK